MFFRVFPWQNRTETTQTIGGLKMYQGIFIDDQEADKDFALLMSTPGKKGLTVKFQQPTELMTLANHIVESPPAFVVLNYRQQMPYAYKAEPLAQLLRSYSSENVTQDFPIVLLSHEEDITGFLNNVTAHNLFDCLFTKQEVAGDPEHRQKMLSLVKGYRRMIKKWHKKSERWATFFGLNKEERGVVAYQAILELDKLKAPHQVAQQILHYVIGRQGILLDKENVLAQCGVAKESKDIDTLFEVLKQNKVIYSGVFSEGWPRWWQHRLWDWEKQVCDESLGNLTARERVACLNEKLGLNLSPAKSRWQEHTDALFAYACDSCLQPTEDQYSVAAYDPLPHTYIRGKRICWKCIETGEFKEQGLEYNNDEEFIVDLILKGEM
jgi:hypothetical protein